jgi:hypothetical protein
VFLERLPGLTIISTDNEVAIKLKFERLTDLASMKTSEVKGKERYSCPCALLIKHFSMKTHGE